MLKHIFVKTKSRLIPNNVTITEAKVSFSSDICILGHFEGAFKPPRTNELFFSLFFNDN